MYKEDNMDLVDVYLMKRYERHTHGWCISAVLLVQKDTSDCLFVQRWDVDTSEITNYVFDDIASFEDMISKHNELHHIDEIIIPLTCVRSGEYYHI